MLINKVFGPWPLGQLGLWKQFIPRPGQKKAPVASRGQSIREEWRYG